MTMFPERAFLAKLLISPHLRAVISEVQAWPEIKCLCQALCDTI